MGVHPAGFLDNAEIEMTVDVLVVEDSPAITMLLRRVLESAGLAMLEARDGLHALNVLRRAKLPSCLITEINMPRMDGIEFIRVVRSDPRLGRIPIVVLTGENDDHRIAQAESAGASCIIRKPFDIDVLFDVVESIVNDTKADELRSAC